MEFKVLTGTIKKNLLVRYRAYPVDFFIGNVLTGLYTVLGAWMMYTLLFQGKLEEGFERLTGTKDYMSYVIVGSLIYIFVVRTCLNVSRSLITELREGTLESLMLAPFRRREYFLGTMLVQTITTLMELVFSILIALPFGINFTHINILSFFVSALVALYAFFGMSMMLGCIMLYTRDTYISQNTLFAFLFLICGITFPAQYLPRWLQLISNLVPVTNSVTLIRNSVLLNSSIKELYPQLVQVFALSSIYVYIGFKLMKICERVALEKING